MLGKNLSEMPQQSPAQGNLKSHLSIILFYYLYSYI